MAARKLAAATASTVLSVATSLVLTRPARIGDTSSLHQLHFEKHDIEEHFIFSLSQDGDQFLGSAEKILEEAGEEIAHSVGRFKKSSLLDNAKVGALVSARFVDLLTRAAVVLLDYKLHGLLDTSDQELSEVHKRAANSLYEACVCHGGLLVKFGQYLSNNAGTIVPREYVEALTPLQDRCTPLPIEVIRECVEEELSKLLVDGAHGDGNLIDQVFQDFDPVPLGAASLAQVHSATLKDGRRVAIKVQRKNLSTTTKADMLALQILARAVDRAFPGSGFEWMLPEFHQTITAELDFTQEATNAVRCSKMLRGVDLSSGFSLFNFFGWWQGRSPTAIVPTPIPELTTDKMLTMTFEDGFKVTDIKKLHDHGIDPRKVAGAVCAVFAELMLVHGFVYIDSHPGNVLVRPRSEGVVARGEFDIVLLDHGMYRRLDEVYRSGYCNLWAGLINGDDNQALKGIRALGLEDKFLDIMGLVMVYRIPQSFLDPESRLAHRKVGLLNSAEYKHVVMEHVRRKFGGDVTPASVNVFLQSQSRDFLYCSRCTSLVRGLNLQLGGTTTNRFLAFGSAANRGASLNSGDDPIVPPAADHITDDMDMLAKVKAELNRPVVSELLAERNSASYKKDTTVSFRESYYNGVGHCNMIVRTWWRGLFRDAVYFLTRSSVTYSRQVG